MLGSAMSPSGEEAMSTIRQLIASHYDGIMKRTAEDCPGALEQIDEILQDIRDHIQTIDRRVFSKRNDLLIAIRLVEAFRIFNWIKICLACGAYQSVFRELRFMLDGVAQAYYIDINHIDAPLSCKLEVYRALGEIRGFMGRSLLDRIKGLPVKKELEDVYRDLSNFVHPSVEESRNWIASPPPEGPVDSLKQVRYDRELLDEALGRCRQVGDLLIKVNANFVEKFLEIAETD